jgi:carbamoyl-phosphate synthase large subunit
MASQKSSSRPRVLVTGTGNPSGIAVMKALGGEPLDIYSADVDPHAWGLSLVDEDRRLLIPTSDRDSWTELVYELCERHRIDVLIPTVDTELVLLASARVFFADIGTKIVLASEKTLRMCLDRWALHRRCTGAVRVPESILVDEAFDPFSPKLPAIVKPRIGNGSRGTRMIERREELEQMDRDGSLIVQEHLPGAEYSLDTLARSDGRVIAVVPWARLKVDSGTVATESTVRGERLQTTARQIAERIELTSVASIQVKDTSDGEPALLGINPCFLGTMPLTVASGVNMPKLCVDDALGLPRIARTAEGVANG